ncbi:ORC-CDC6 family AAA ATPase [Loktanella sp. M215]|uniref:ORC-CDC6 family AAA ATPase n=1 Tax=Loktanella sp. M215 TaxID=2675431 RepID=UPI001F3934E0|nr:hypothetical protein [Loktanella sp. M215]MCF7701506.1 hypothetical protein [Loktanella sp. M215]
MLKGLQGFGNNSFTEEGREYELVDIIKILRGGENRRTLFQDLCEDVFDRRLRFAEFDCLPKGSKLTYLFGKRASAEDKVATFIRDSGKRVISSDFQVSPLIKNALSEVSRTNPISAKLGEAWTRQNIDSIDISPELIMSEPWQSKVWWKKERKQQALMQVFSTCRQKLVWYGAPDIVLLSGKNIFVFLSICQFIWAEYLRSTSESSQIFPKGIDPLTQATGIHSASEYWFRKVRAEPKGGDDRHRFANVLGTAIRDRLTRDKSMSYPGENGFSLPVKDLEAARHVESFLENCVSFGVLEQHSHTSKSRSRGQSQKWFLSSILTPYFQIPTAHTKEPIYSNIEDIEDWMCSARVSSAAGVSRSKLKKKYISNPIDEQLTLNFRGGVED